MQRATDLVKLANQLVNLELRAPGLRGQAGEVALIQQVEREHAGLLAEYAKVTIRAVLQGGAVDFRPAAMDAPEPLEATRARVQAALTALFNTWAGQPLPPAHDAVKYATTILEATT